ncbi:CUB and sushi domain-containing protein 3-like [Branchiostoma floridae x Branchiostoma belcheri]
MTGSNFYQDVVHFTCGSGYDLVGNPTVTCQADATWSGTVPTCTRKQCPLLTAPANGAMTGSNFYQDVAQFTCDTGYDRVGNAAVTCQADATWSGNVPTCTLKECPLLSAPTNGAMTGTNFYQDVATFTCDSGYDLVGNPILTCQADATWDLTVPICTRKECPLLAAPANGAKIGSNFYQDVLHFTCSSGYDLVGNFSITCQADATWSGSVPTCTPVECPLLTAPVNGSMTGSNFYQDLVHFTCIPGYELDGRSSLACRADATWSGTVPTCIRVQCPFLAAPSNGGMTGSNFYEDLVQFTCNSGYDLLGNTALVCQADTTWNGTVPSCTRIECPLLTAPANGAQTGSNFYQDAMYFSCYSGFDLVGNSVITCQADETWTAAVPTCTRIQCPLLTAPVDGAMTGSNYYQDMVEFTCNSGYDRVGTSSLTCQADRTWTGVAPTCTRVECPLFTTPVNGGMTGGNFYQDVVLFTCDTGYELVGLSSSLTCQADRTWDGTAPSCTRVECPALIAPVNGEMTGFNFYQDVMQFMCDSGYDLIGSASLTCQADRTWSGVTPTCTRVQCPVLPSPMNGVATGPNFYMDTIHFTYINECSVANGGCDHVCTNTMGTFHCSCVTGYTLDADGYSCSDINECNFGNGGCQQNCINLIGSFHCSCGIGYELNSDGFNCDDKDECFIANGGCDQTCSNTIGSFFCSCGTGYVLNGNGFFCDAISYM